MQWEQAWDPTTVRDFCCSRSDACHCMLLFLVSWPTPWFVALHRQLGVEFHQSPIRAPSPIRVFS